MFLKPYTQRNTQSNQKVPHEGQDYGLGCFSSFRETQHGRVMAGVNHFFGGSVFLDIPHWITGLTGLVGTPCIGSSAVWYWCRLFKKWVLHGIRG